MDYITHFDDETMIKAHDTQVNDWMIPVMGAFESMREISWIYETPHENTLKNNINFFHFIVYKLENQWRPSPCQCTPITL